MKVWMYLRLVIGLLLRKRLHFILLTTIHRFKVDFSVFCSICLKSGNTKPLVTKWPCCFKDIYKYIYIYINRLLEHSAWTRWLGVRVLLRSKHFLPQNLWHFHKNTRSCVENECCCPRTVNISNVNVTSKISIPPEPVFKTWDSKCVALIAQ